MPNDASDKLSLFLRFVFGKATEGFVCIASRDFTSKKFEERFFEYPTELTQIVEYVQRMEPSNDLWYCPQLLTTRARKKENIAATPSAWSDLDTCDPSLMLVEPSIIIESSPGRWQALWRFKGDVAPMDAESISRRIAYYHADDGADKSGWDLTQLLRVPLTLNFKYADMGSPPQVRIAKAQELFYDVKDFEGYPQPKDFAYTDIPLPDDDKIPHSSETWAKYHGTIPPVAFLFFSQEPKADDDWSKTLWSLEMLFFEAGATLEEVFGIAYDAACNKYRRDGRNPAYLWREVCRAWQAYEEKSHEHGASFLDILDPLLTDTERQHCIDTPGFVEEYIEWAKTLGDAAWQYHQAGAFIILSALLSGSVKLDTSYGTVVPNLWFMILADTTLTRKTTAMDVAMDLLNQIDDNAVLATDGSIEGLFTAIGTRPNRPSIFLRDEFTGLLEAMVKKDYYAGMAEQLTKLYDGKYQKRILKRETVEVKDPILITFAGGIKNRTFELLTYEHVSSGFLPRFIFITAEADITRLKPLGPPTESTTGEKDRLIHKLTQLQEHFSTKQEIIVNKTVNLATPKTWKATLTPEAWYKYNLMESAMLKAAGESIHKEVLMPMFDRLSKSGLKASILIAASRMEDEVIITEADIVRAFYYVEQWRGFAMEVVKNIGKTNFEKSVDSCMTLIKNQPGIYRGDIMRKLHLTARGANELLDTLDQRGLIKQQKSGKAIRIFMNEGAY